jgi:CRP/FNR family transcriptional regulator, cyclic AMP receptor protein
MATAAAMMECTITRIEKGAMIRRLRDEPPFCERFTAYLLTRNARIEEDLVDQLFNSSERRLARLLLMLANFGKDERPDPIIATRSPAPARLGGRRR